MPIHLFILFNKMNVALRERDADARRIQRFVNHFLGTVYIPNPFGNQHVLLHGYLYRAVGHIVDHDVDSVLGLHDLPAIRILGPQFLHRLYQHLANLLDVGPIGHARNDLGELIGVVAGQVVEVLAEEGGIEERHLRAVQGFHHHALVVDGHHLPAHAVAFNPVSNPQAAAHQLDTIDKVVQDILESQTDTGRQTAGNEPQRSGRDVQHGDHHHGVSHPNQDGDDAVAQGQVDLIGPDGGPVVLAHKGDIPHKLPDGVNGLVEISQGKEQDGQADDAPAGDAERLESLLVQELDERNIENLVGVIFDREALGYTVMNEWSATTPLNASGGYWNTFYHFLMKWWVDYSEKGIILLLD